MISLQNEHSIDMTLQLLSFREYVIEKFNYTAAILLHVFNTYDPVWTTGLIYRLDTAGIPISSLLLLGLYITDRKYRVKVEGQFLKSTQTSRNLHQLLKGNPLCKAMYGVYAEVLIT
jgi:hypothetical protein